MATQTTVEKPATKLVSKWYFGGLASAGAACITHPIDLTKVHLQTQQEVKMRGYQMVIKIVKNEGVMAMYNGLSASIGRQMTYSLVRFAIYETVKNSVLPQDANRPMPFYQKALLAGFAGACGGFVGTPCDMINVRMQNDVKLPLDKRRNYKHVFDGLWKTYKFEGRVSLFNGASMATSRAVLMTIGQIGLYDQFKQMLLQTGIFKDNLVTHFSSSLMAGFCATVLTQPFDVMKTRLMNAKPGEFKSFAALVVYTAKLGPSGFYKGFIPAFVRLAPQTIFTFIFFEQLRLNFGREIAVKT
ncbi:mitochondrial dicarboxylate carrier-like [Amphiura filiformis]|uniref:mitochondrial dicarboxylate carrier-like n=1 Tax=Amphiura filiformis TaxID=82378 RepID=UPI003B212235